MLRDQKAMRWGGDRHPDACLFRKEAARWLSQMGSTGRPLVLEKSTHPEPSRGAQMHSRKRTELRKATYETGATEDRETSPENEQVGERTEEPCGTAGREKHRGLWRPMRTPARDSSRRERFLRRPPRA